MFYFTKRNNKDNNRECFNEDNDRNGLRESWRDDRICKDIREIDEINNEREGLNDWGGDEKKIVLLN